MLLDRRLSTRTHLLTVAWIYGGLGLVHLVLGAAIAAEQWKEMQRYSGTLGEGIALAIFLLGIIGVAWSMLYLRVATVYFGAARGSRTEIPCTAVITLMILGIPYGTAAGVYALFVRRRILRTEDSEEDPEKARS